MRLSEELSWRGFVNQTTLTNLDALDNKKMSFYHGYDASSDSLTIGNLAALMLDKLFLKHGHKGYLLMGGATSLVGDPGGKDRERSLQSVQTIEDNIEGIKKQVQKLMDKDTIFVNNLDWLKDFSVLEFLRDVGKHFSMTPLVQRDYIAKRLGKGGSGISYAELSYTILQGYDFLYLYKKYGVDLQLSGSDQWGNILSGIELIRKTEGKEAHAFTMPLIINKATGKKFGKSEGGAVWLDSVKTDPIKEFYQFWLNLDDEGLEGYLKIYTELSKEEIEKVMHHHNSDRAQRHGQKKLAWEVTAMVHGKQVADKARDFAENLGSSSVSAEAEDKLVIKITDGIAETLVRAQLSSSKTEARQLLEAGGIYINDQQINRQNFEDKDFKNGPIRLRRGKKLNKFVLVDIKEK